MMRNLKIGVILAAVLATSAIGAASAQAGSLDVGAAPAWLTGTQENTASGKHKWIVTSVSGVTLTTVKCTTANYDITTSTLSVTHFTATPTFGGANECELGGLAATVSPGTCTFTFSGVGLAALSFDVSVVNCTSTLSIVQGSCTLSVPNTVETLKTVSFTSTTGLSPDHVTLHFELKKIPISGSAGCPANLVGSTNTADTSGTITTKAFSDINGVEGSQVSLTAT